ncbi:hypothetical protein Y032_0353g3298 [Ancylostoma ceylanicum]|uniref:Uncharacterized protein n=1 Tax=Ancylostoma ceylanicum TaxID=53326 RepID=A0A016RWE1_9BILA|nr:hypothetical protein Y032_0353g3298 [Ancylostoma ceylanicum]
MLIINSYEPDRKANAGLVWCNGMVYGVSMYGVSMVKEARRPPERQLRRRCDTVTTGVANDLEISGNLDITLAAITNGVRWAVDEMSDGCDIAVDGAYDSRGFSTAFCNVLAVDLKTKLCLHSENLLPERRVIPTIHMLRIRSDVYHALEGMTDDGARQSLSGIHVRKSARLADLQPADRT